MPVEGAGHESCLLRLATGPEAACMVHVQDVPQPGAGSTATLDAVEKSPLGIVMEDTEWDANVSALPL